MQPFIKFLYALVCAILIAWVLAACASYMPRRIERDATLWYPYHLSVDDSVYRIRIPSGALIIKEPVTEISAASVEDYFIVAVFGFDYGRGSYNDIAQLTIRVTLSRIDAGIICGTDESRFGDCILQDAKVSTKGNINQYKVLGSLQWFHEKGSILPWDNYSILVGENHYLTIEAYYWDDLAERPDMLADRRNLVKEIVSAVQEFN